MPDLATTMHAHFFLDNRVWRQAAANISSYMEEDECYTNEYKLCEALSMGQKFLYIFDFGEERQIDPPSGISNIFTKLSAADRATITALMVSFFTLTFLFFGIFSVLSMNMR